AKLKVAVLVQHGLHHRYDARLERFELEHEATHRRVPNVAARVGRRRMEINAVDVDTLYAAEALGLAHVAAEEVDRCPANLAMRIAEGAHNARTRLVIHHR